MVGLFIDLVSTGGRQVLQKFIITVAQTSSHLPTITEQIRGRSSQRSMCQVYLLGPLLVEVLWSGVKRMDAEASHTWAPVDFGQVN